MDKMRKVLFVALLISIVAALTMPSAIAATITDKNFEDYAVFSKETQEIETPHIGPAKYKFSVNEDIVIASKKTSQSYCTVDWDKKGKLTDDRGFWEWIWDFITGQDPELEYEGIMHCEIPVEIINKNPAQTRLKSYSIEFVGLEQYAPEYKYSTEYDTVYEESVVEAESKGDKVTLIASEITRVAKREFKNYKDIDSLAEIDLTKPISVMAVFDMPAAHFLKYDVIVSGKIDSSLFDTDIVLDPWVGAITNCTWLQNMSDDLSASWYLGGDIDCEDTINWNGGNGWMPVANNSGGALNQFKGQFDGRNYTIKGLWSFQPNVAYGGLFGYTVIGSNISNVNIVNATINSSSYGGILTGACGSMVRNVSVSGNVTATDGSGGIFGLGDAGLSIEDSYSVTNTTSNCAGGLGGYVQGGNYVNRSYSTGNATSTNRAGGFICRLNSAGFLVQDSFGTGWAEADATNGAGVMIADLDDGIIDNLYWYNASDGRAPQCFNAGNNNCTVQTDINYFKGDVYPGSEPFVDWDFTDTWTEVSGGFPDLFFGDVPPTVALVSPADALETLTTTQTFNGTCMDNKGLQSCHILFHTGRIYNLTTSATNQSVQVSQANLPYGTYNWTVLAIDSDGLSSIGTNQTITLTPVTFNNFSFSNRTTEGDTEYFECNLTVDSSRQISTANLNYGGYNFSTTINNLGSGDYKLTRTIDVPLTSSAKNNTFFYEILLDDNSQKNSSSYSQEVWAIAADNCTTYAVTILNMTIEDEETLVIPDINGQTLNSTIEVDLNIYSQGEHSGTPVLNYNNTFNNRTNVKICVEENMLNNSVFDLYLEARYKFTDHASEFYYIQNYTLTNNTIPEDLEFLDLHDDDAVEFLITYKDDSFLPVSDALINIKRKYIGEGLFRSVEIPKTDDSGHAVGKFDTDNAVYTITVTKYGQVLASFSNIAVICNDETIGDCELNLKEVMSIDQVNDFDTYRNVDYTITFDEDTRTITTSFTTIDGSTVTAQSNATKFDRWGNDTMCSHTLTTSSGTLTCTIPNAYGNVTAVSSFYVDGQLVKQKTFKINPDLGEYWGELRFILLVFLFMTIPLMLITTTIGPIIGIILGVIIAVVLKLLGNAANGPLVLWTLITGGIIIWKLSQRNA